MSLVTRYGPIQFAMLSPGTHSIASLKKRRENYIYPSVTKRERRLYQVEQWVAHQRTKGERCCLTS